jgi:phenylacetate-CoA ligase
MAATVSLLQQTHELFMESQFWPIKRLAEYQRLQLGHLLRHTRKHSPFYRDRLNVLFGQDGSIDWARWLEVPILTREELRDCREELVSKVVPPGHEPIAEHSTSGSTGVPVRPLSTAATATANRAAQLRSFLNLGIDLRSPAAIFSRYGRDGKPMTDRYHSMKWNHPWIMGNERADYYTIAQTLEPSVQLQLLHDLGIRMMFETSNRTVLLAKINLQRSKPVRLEWVQCYGQGLAAEGRVVIEQSFGAKVVQIYSSTEAGLMACQCSKIDGYHVNAEMGLVEILDERNRPCRPGARGRIVVTPFLATALPLIRYEQSDTAMELPACSCGSSLPRIGAIEGKNDDLLMLPTGPMHLGNSFLRKIDLSGHVLALQIAQTAPDAIEFRYVPKGPVDPAWESSTCAILRSEIYDQLQVVFCPMAQLPLNARGKQQTFIRLGAHIPQ